MESNASSSTSGSACDTDTSSGLSSGTTNVLVLDWGLGFVQEAGVVDEQDFEELVAIIMNFKA